eukprot:967156-Pleurochrysis_carterae.AAC.3
MESSHLVNLVSILAGFLRNSIEDAVVVAHHRVECILGAGLYAPQLRGWLRFYEPKQFLLFEAKQARAE